MATAPTSARSGPRRSPLAGLGREGFAIVVVVALIDAMRASAKVLASEPFTTWLEEFAGFFLYAATIGCVLLVAVVLVRNRVPGHGVRQYAAVFSGIVVAAALVVLVDVGLWIWLGDGAEQPVRGLLIWMISEWPRYALLGSLVAGAWLYVSADAEQAAQAERVAIDAAQMAEQVAEARLRMLEAQIEPHFLFNTLAHVQRLFETDPANGARMLRSLKAYLGIALPQMREAESTLRREVAHVRSYLDIQSIRMGRRLAYAIDVPAELEDAGIPPLMLVTLVENAVKHGVAPARAGGRIDMRASAHEGSLRIVIADTGQGFAASSGAGTGLANIRARLRARFGDAAGLALAHNEPHGVVATLALPLQRAASGVAD